MMTIHYFIQYPRKFPLVKFLKSIWHITPGKFHEIPIQWTFVTTRFGYFFEYLRLNFIH